MDPAWLAANRANWDERVGIHLGLRGYDLSRLRAGRGLFTPIEEAALPPLDRKRVLHLQCHFGSDTLKFVQRGAEATGVDFSPAAIAAANDLANELKLSARFILSDVYDAPTALPEPASFDLAFASWGTICWLPDVARWAEVIAYFLRPGGVFVFADGHPAALTLDDGVPGSQGLPGWFAPYLDPTPMQLQVERDYADPEAVLTNNSTWEWLHPVGDVVTALIRAGLRLEFLREHNAVAWQMFKCLTQDTDGLFRWPDRPWLPLSYSLRAVRT
jgi:SAM-dependent methyltransferase